MAAWSVDAGGAPGSPPEDGSGPGSDRGSDAGSRDGSGDGDGHFLTLAEYIAEMEHAIEDN